MKILFLFLILFVFSIYSEARMGGIFTTDGFYACKNQRLLLEADSYVDDGDREALNKMYASDDCFTTEADTQVFIVRGSFLDCTEGDRMDCSYVIFHPIEIRVKGSRETWWTYRTFLKRSSS